jgi:molybdopterin/thiamine biosynthesis adenylyltransferase
MSELLYPNPYATILVTDDSIFVKALKDLSFGLSCRDGFDQLMAKTSISREELQDYFSIEEIEELIQAHVLLPSRELVPDTNSFLSRQRGFFSIFSSDYSIMENQLGRMRVLILGAGALGTHILWSLISVGVRDISIIDFDTIEESNLNRQLYYGENDVGQSKVDVLQQKIKSSHPQVTIRTAKMKIQSEEDLDRIINHDFVFKAFDTPPEGTEWVNAVCVRKRIPYISGGFINELGIVGPVYVPSVTPCAACFEHEGGNRLNSVSPTFSPIVTAVASRIIQTFFWIISRDFDNVAPYSTYSYFTGKWTAMREEPAEKCKICGRDSVRYPLSRKTTLEFLPVALISIACCFASLALHSYIINYVMLLVLAVAFRRRALKPDFIFISSSIIAAVNLAIPLMDGTFQLSQLVGASNPFIAWSYCMVFFLILVMELTLIWFLFGQLMQSIGRRFKHAHS